MLQICGVFFSRRASRAGSEMLRNVRFKAYPGILGVVGWDLGLGRPAAVPGEFLPTFFRDRPRQSRRQDFYFAAGGPGSAWPGPRLMG